MNAKTKPRYSPEDMVRDIAAARGGEPRPELAALARSNGSQPDTAASETPPQPEPPAIATTTAAAIRRSAEQVIEDIQNQRDQALRAFKDFDAAASEAQQMIKGRSDTIAASAEQFITTLAGSALQVRRIGNDVATFGGDR